MVREMNIKELKKVAILDKKDVFLASGCIYINCLLINSSYGLFNFLFCPFRYKTAFLLNVIISNLFNNFLKNLLTNHFYILILPNG